MVSVFRYVFVVFLLLGCSTGNVVYAPVTSATIEPIPKKGYYRVQAHETLYSIAWRYGLDYRYVAARNHINAPYAIYQGQILYLMGQAKTLPLKPTPEQKKTFVPQVEPTETVSTWSWPAKGPIASSYGESNKGIDIRGHLGDPIFATAPGKVVYSGNGIRGYGNLIIVKHNSLFLTAYAHNNQLLVKEGEWVRRGQKIAEMGRSGTRNTILHFEIRRGGTPVNPVNYLK